MLRIHRVTAEEIKINLLVYGLPGVGKTSFAAQANEHPEMSPALFLDLEGGTLSIANRGDVDSIRITGSKDFEDVLTAVASGSSEVAEYRTLVIDSGSMLAKTVLGEWTRRNHERAVKKSRGDPDRTQDDIQLEDYGKMTAQMRRLFAWARELPVHVIMTSLAKFTMPDSEGSKANPGPIDVCPDFTAGLQTSVMGMMDFVWYYYLYEEKVKDAKGKETGETITHRAMLTETQGVFRAKTRGARFAEAVRANHPKRQPRLIDPYLPSVYDVLVSSERGEDIPTGYTDSPNGTEEAATTAETEEMAVAVS